MRFARVRRGSVWTGATALLVGTIGVLGSPSATAATATVGDTTLTAVGADTATLTAPVNPGGTSTISASCTGGTYTASTSTVTGSSTATRTVSLTGLSGYGKYVCAVTATQGTQPVVKGSVPAAFYTTAQPSPVTLYVDGNPAALGGGTKTAGCTGPGANACQTIQQAVNAAQALANTSVTISVQGITAFQNGAYTESVTIAVPDTVRLKIKGTGNPVVHGMPGKSVFSISGPTLVSGVSPRVTLDSLTITGGEASGNSGGGVTVSGDVVWLANNTITANRGNTGAGVYNNSTNQLTLINNTITGNVGGTTGGSLGVAAFTLQGSTVLLNNTLSDNPPAGAGTGLDNGAQGRYRLFNSILLRTSCGNHSASTDGGHNVESANTCGLDASANRVNNSAIHLAPTLAANGSTGPQTLAIDPSSSAHNLVPIADCTVTFDARGLGRPGFDGQNCDAGAFEIQAPSVAPTIGATAVSDVTDTTATLTAPVNPGGAPTSLNVTCTGGAYAWTSSSPGAGHSAVTATANLTGLTPGTPYSCSMSATNSAGSAGSATAATFTTSATPPVATPTPTPAPTATPAGTPTPTPTPTPTATPAPPSVPTAPAVGTTSVAAITTNGATVSAAVTPNGAPTSATATCSGGNWAAGGVFAGSGAAPANVSIPLTSLTSGTVYTCAVRATNSAGETTSTQPVTFTTAGSAPAHTASKLSIAAKSFKATKGKSKTYTVATFTDTGNAPASAYRATITWGDGTTSKGKIVKTGTGTYKVTGKHKYAKAGKKAVKVSVARAGAAQVTATSKATAA